MLGMLCGLFFMTWSLYLQRGLGMSPFHAALLGMTAPVADRVRPRHGRRPARRPVACPGPHLDAGVASGLFNTAIHLGAALTALVFFAATGHSPDAGLNREAFITVPWWVGGHLALMRALMFYLPRRYLVQEAPFARVTVISEVGGTSYERRVGVVGAEYH